jgi:hypothetical protein
MSKTGCWDSGQLSPTVCSGGRPGIRSANGGGLGAYTDGRLKATCRGN